MIAAGVAAIALTAASPASAVSYVKLLSDTMDKTFQASISGVGTVYSNGVSFRAQDFVLGSGPGTGAVGPVYDLFGFCVDVFHSISAGTTGNPNTLNDVYQSNEDLNIVNPLPNDFGGHTITTLQRTKLTNLIDTGWNLHQLEVQTNNFAFDTQMRLAAIQAAIWAIEVPSKTVAVVKGSLTTAQFNTYKGYFDAYKTGGYTSTADANDRFYVISDYAQSHSETINQAFAIGWPIVNEVQTAVPEPATWAMMIMGFGAMGSLLRRRRKAPAIA